MRFRSLKKWDDPSASAALLFFAQILEEILFDFSMDTYKASVMQSGLLCIEALQTINEVESGNIAEPNIRHVIDELCANLVKDTVAQKLIKLPISSFLGVLKNKTTPIKDIKGLIELISFNLTPTAYRKKNEEMIATAIKSNAKPHEIRRLARSYITTLTAIGFSTKHLRDVTLNFFTSTRIEYQITMQLTSSFLPSPKKN